MKARTVFRYAIVNHFFRFFLLTFPLNMANNICEKGLATPLNVIMRSGIAIVEYSFLKNYVLKRVKNLRPFVMG